jgi:hypothetical protein
MPQVTRSMIVPVALFVVCGAVFAADQAPNSPQTRFVLANENYRKAFDAVAEDERRRLLEEAVRLYSEVIERVPSAHAFHNLGNALFRLNRVGESIAAYRKALLLGGQLPDTAANLDYARTRCTGTPYPPEPGPVAKALLFWYYASSIRGLEQTAMAAWFAAWGLVLVWLWRGGKHWGTAVAVILLFALAAGIGHAVRAGEWRAPSTVVVKADTKAVSEARPSATPLFEIGEGSEVRVARRRSGWTEILLPDARRGWLPDEALAK